MESIRILLAGMPRLMSDLVEVGLRMQSDMEVVCVLDSLARLAEAAHDEEPDVVVLGVEGMDLPQECGALLAVRPQLRILGIQDDGAEAGLYELRPHRASLGALSPVELPALLQSVAAEPARLWEVR